MLSIFSSILTFIEPFCRHCFALQDHTKDLQLHPGLNTFELKTKAGPTVGLYCINQMSMKILGGKLDLLTEKWPQGKKQLRYSVITEPHSFTVSSEKLWAGFLQEVQLNIFTGSHHLHKVPPSMPQKISFLTSSTSAQTR